MASNTPQTPQAGSQARAKISVAGAGGIMMASLFLSRVLGIFRDTVQSARFGVGIQTDAYRLAFQLPDLLFYLVAGGALSTAFIPVFSELIHTDREEDAWKLFSVVTTVMSIALILIIGASWVFANPIMSYLAAGKSPDTILLIVRMSRIVLPAQFAFFIGGLMFGTLYAYQRFSAPGLAPNIYNLGIIFGAIFLSDFFRPGIVGMSWGALFGAICGSLILPYFAMRQLSPKFKLSLDIHAPGVGKVFKLMLPVILGLSLPGVYGLIMQKFGAVYPAGINTALDYSDKLMRAPLGIIGQSLALAVFPTLSQFYAQDRQVDFRRQFASSLRTVIFLGCPASAFLFSFAPIIVNLAYGYGRTRPEMLIPIENCLRLFAIGTFAWCIHPLMMRTFFSRHQSIKPIVIGTCSTLLFIILYQLIKSQFGYGGLPIANTIAGVCLALAMGTAVYREIGGFDLKGVLTTFGKSFFASAIAGGVAYWAAHSVHSNSHKMVALLTFCGAGFLMIWVYVLIATLLKMPETEYVSRSLSKVKAKLPWTPSSP